MAKILRFKAICFDWGNTIEIGRPLIVETILQVWQRVLPEVTYADVLAAMQDAWQELAKVKPTKKDLQDMSEFRQMLYARQAEIMANALGVDPDVPDWPWVANVFFNEHYFKNRTWSIPKSHASVLRKIKAAGIPMVIIANNEDPAELPQLIADLGLTGFFDHEIASSSFGHRKPHPKIYHAALNVLELRADEVLYVGDDYHNDYWGPAQVGMFPLLFDPQKIHIKVAGIRRIEKFEQLFDFLFEKSGGN